MESTKDETDSGETTADRPRCLFLIKQMNVHHINSDLRTLSDIQSTLTPPAL